MTGTARQRVGRSGGAGPVVAGAGHRAALLAAGDRPVLIDPDGRRRSGLDLAERVDRLTGALSVSGLAGRRIGLWYRNSVAAVEAFLAVEWLGGTRVPVDPGAPAAEARAVFEAADVDLVLADAEHATLLPGAVTHDDEQPLGGVAYWPAVPVDPRRALLLYPRQVLDGQLLAVPISYANWAETMRVNLALYRGGRYGPPVDQDDVFLTVQQLMHGTGMLGTFPFLLLGLPQVVLGRFDPAAALDAMDRFGVTSTMLVSGMLPPLTSAAGSGNGASGRGTSLRRVLYGGAPLPAATVRAALDSFGPVLVQVYGRLEGGWPISVLGTDAHARILAGDDALVTSCGRPVDEVRTRVDPDTGELSVRTPMAVHEYTDHDGWCSLGDVVSRDDNGYLFHRGRLDGMINNGYHVYPGEVEQALRQLPEVADARVVGEPDPRRGQRVVAYVMPRAGGDDALATRLRAQLRQRLAGYKVPERIDIVTTFPPLG
ncbi:class I adenylate-forming enzyme family protein [Plantactinospora sp. GCM10030261]|uniref:class I adenylate-forming enzyme family protein n=1 Tax=Plantactinospora sp. GCM10030261 TaxID=3273420 RepID=UPI003623F4F4